MSHILTRRRALTILALICGGYIGKSLNAKQQTTTTESWWNQFPPGTLEFHLNTFKEYKFVLGSQTVIVTPEELMKALEG